MWGEVTGEVEGEPWQGGAQSQRRGSDTAEVSNDSPGIVLLNYEMHVQTVNIRYYQHYSYTSNNSLQLPRTTNFFIRT